jgi:hypothetical protein
LSIDTGDNMKPSMFKKHLLNKVRYYTLIRCGNTPFKVVYYTLLRCVLEPVLGGLLHLKEVYLYNYHSIATLLSPFLSLSYGQFISQKHERPFGGVERGQMPLGGSSCDRAASKTFYFHLETKNTQGVKRH